VSAYVFAVIVPQYGPYAAVRELFPPRLLTFAAAHDTILFGQDKAFSAFSHL